VNQRVRSVQDEINRETDMLTVTIVDVEDLDEAIEILTDTKTDTDVLSALRDPSIVTIPFEGGEIEKN
jgi:hypothetical protein